MSESRPALEHFRQPISAHKRSVLGLTCKSMTRSKRSALSLRAIPRIPLVELSLAERQIGLSMFGLFLRTSRKASLVRKAIRASGNLLLRAAGTEVARTTSPSELSLITSMLGETPVSQKCRDARKTKGDLSLEVRKNHCTASAGRTESEIANCSS